MMFSNVKDAAKRVFGRGSGCSALLRRFGALLLAVCLLAAIPAGAVAAEDAAPTETAAPTEVPAATDTPAPADPADGTVPEGGAGQTDDAATTETVPEPVTVPRNDYVLIGGTERISVDAGDMKGLLSGVTIETQKGETVADGKLFVGEKYKITLAFAEGGAQSAEQFAWNDDGTMTFQLPANFKVEPKADVPLTINIDGEDVTIGTYSVTEDGKLVVTLNEEGRQALSNAADAALNFEMDATVQAAEGDDEGRIKFDDAGEDFDFEVVDQARVEVDKQGKFTENEGGTGGKLEYTVTTTVKRGSVSGLAILDELTPPETSALEVKDVDPEDIKVTLKRLEADGSVTEVELTRDKDYELVEVEDAEHPGKKTFHIQLKEAGEYKTLNEGDALTVAYPYQVEYVNGSTDVFWGNVANDVNVTGKGTVPPPADEPDKVMPEIDIDEHRGSEVEIVVTPPGDGIIFKTQEFSEAEHKLHYTLYTVVPAGNWRPFYIQDDMVVEFGGERYYLPEFKEGGRVSNLQVSTMAVQKNALGGWSDKNGEQRRQTLEELKKGAKDLGAGFRFEDFPSAPTEDKSQLPAGYDPENMEQWVYLYINSGNRLDIIFGFEGGKYGEYDGKWGHWNITDHDTLIITEYDLDMSNDRGKIALQKMGDTSSTLEKEASEVLLAGIKNNANMRFSGYYPGYSVFFNNAERMNKTGVPDKSDNTIEFTVTMNTTDATVNKYFCDVNQDMWDTHLNWNSGWYYNTMQAVFYDVLPDGWDYVKGSLSVTTTHLNGYTQTFFYPEDKTDIPAVLTEDGRAINAPLILFRDDVSGSKNKELFNMLSDTLTQLTFTYKLKATDQWIRDHATDTDSVTVHNHAEIRDKLKKQPHWTADTNVPYLPQHLSKTAQQVGDGSNLLRFTLTVNPGSATLDSETGYLVVTDKSDNLEIQKSTIKVTDAGDHPLTQVTYEEGMKLEDDQWAIMPETESGQFRLMVPDGRALLVTYDALIPELGPDISVSNTAGIEGVVNSSSGFDRIISVDHIVAGGAGSTYTLNFKKVDSTNSAKKLPGAKFKFYIVLDGGSDLTKKANRTVAGKEYSCYSEDGWVFTTDADGLYQIPSDWRLAPGNYYILEEIEAPEGYQKLEEPVLFYFGAANQVDRENHPNARSALPGGTLTVSDPPKPSLRVAKLGRVSSEETSQLEGAKFALYKQAQQEDGSLMEELVREGESKIGDGEEAVVRWDPSGELDLRLNETGTYILRETEAPDGYGRLEEDIVLQVTEDGKIVPKGESLPEGVVFEQNDTAVFKFTVTDPSGYVLPESGGRGTGSLYILGSLFLLSAVLALVCEDRRKKARD